MPLIDRIIGRLIGINKYDCSMAERQIVDLLEESGLVCYDEYDNVLATELEILPCDDADGHSMQKEFQLLQRHIMDLNQSLKMAIQDLEDHFPLIDGEWMLHSDGRIGVFTPQQ